MNTTQQPVRRRVAIITNNVHCERHVQYYATMEKYFITNGWEVVDNFEADKVVICACGFHDAMLDKVMNVMAQLQKVYFPANNVILLGCLPKTHEEALQERFGGHVVALGNEARLDRLTGAAVPFARVDDVNLFRAHHECSITPDNELFAIKISTGCLRKCTFCVINKAKGPIKSVPLPEIERQFRKAVSQGKRRLFLMGEDSFAYGIDCGTTIIELLEHLEAIQPDVELYFGYLHNYWLREYAEGIFSLCRRGIIRELHLGLQHVNDRVLERMGRPGPFAEIYRLIRTIKEENPGFYMGCDIMVGFPGETEQEFEEMVEFFRNDRCFNKVRHFGYCDVKGAKSNHLDGKVPGPEVIRRWEYLDEVLEKRSSYIGLEKASRTDDATFKLTQERDYTFCKDSCMEEVEVSPEAKKSGLTMAANDAVETEDGEFGF